MSQTFDQELVLCGEFLSAKDPVNPLHKLEGVDGELRLKESVNGVSVGQVDVTDKRNDGSLDEAKKDVDYRQEVRDTKGSVEDGTPKAQTGKRADGEWQAQEASKRQLQEPTDSVPDDHLNNAQSTLIWEFLSCEDEDEVIIKEHVQGTVDRQVNEASDDTIANQGSNAQKYPPLWNVLTCQDPGPAAVEVKMLETIEREAQGAADCIPTEQKTMLWDFLTFTPKDQTVGTVDVQVQDDPEREVQDTADVVLTDQAVIVKKNTIWKYVTCEDAAEQQVKETEKALHWEFLTCKNQVQEIIECHLPETSERQVLENVEVQDTAANFRTGQVEMAENNLFSDFLTCQGLTLDDDPQLQRAIEGAPAPDRAAASKSQNDGNLADQVEATQKPNDDAIVEVKKVVENGEVAQIMTSRRKVSPEEKIAANDPPTMKQLAAKPKDSKLKLSVTSAEIRRWAESRDKRQIKAVYRMFGVNPKAVIRMEGQVAIPEPKEEDHVVLKVEVRTRIKTAFGMCPLLLNYLIFLHLFLPSQNKGIDCLRHRLPFAARRQLRYVLN
jgi:hypothetical protein